MAFSASAVHIAVNALLFLRGLESLLTPGEAKVDLPVAGFVTELRRVLQAVTSPKRTIVQAFWDQYSSPGAPEDDFIDRLLPELNSFDLLHSELRYVARFPVPPELPAAITRSISDTFGNTWQEALHRSHFAASGEFHILEHPQRSGRLGSILVVPAVFTVLPLFWPLLMHEFGHRFLRTQTPEENVILESLVATTSAKVRPELAESVANWRTEIAADYFAARLLGGAFVAPALSYFRTFYRNTLGAFTGTHPAPQNRWEKMVEATSGNKPEWPKLRKVFYRVPQLTSNDSQNEQHLQTLPIACSTCKTTLATVETKELPSIEDELTDAVAVVANRLTELEGRPRRPNQTRVASLREMLKLRLPVDLALEGGPIPSRDLVEGATHETGAWLDSLSGISPTVPRVSELFEAAWDERLRLESDFVDQLSKGEFESAKHIENYLGKLIKKLVFLGDNVRSAIRTMISTTEIAAILGKSLHDTE